MNIKKHKICIIGIGKAGSALAIELSAAGASVKFLIDSDIKKLKKLSLKIKGSSVGNKITDKIIENSDIIFIAVRDNEIKRMADSIYKLNVSLKDKLIIHISGALSSDILKSKKISNSNIASFHPIQTFNRISVQNNSLLSGIYFGIEGGRNAISILKKVAVLLSSKYIVIPPSKKYIYHIASVFASNYLVILCDIVSELSRNITGKKADNFNIFEPIITSTLKNIKESGAKSSLTGPVERNDIEMIGRHLTALKKNKKDLIPAYSVLGNAASELAYKKGSISRSDKLKFKKLFNGTLPLLKSTNRN